MTDSRVSLRDVYALSEKIDKKLDTIDHRVSDLEIWRATIKAKMAIIVSAVSIVFTIFYDWFKTKFEK